MTKMGIVLMQFPFFMFYDEILLVELIAAMPSLSPYWGRKTGMLLAANHQSDYGLVMIFAGYYRNGNKYHVCHFNKAIGNCRRRHLKTKEQVIRYIDKHF